MSNEQGPRAANDRPSGQRQEHSTVQDISGLIHALDVYACSTITLHATSLHSRCADRFERCSQMRRIHEETAVSMTSSRLQERPASATRAFRLREAVPFGGPRARPSSGPDGPPSTPGRPLAIADGWTRNRECYALSHCWATVASRRLVRVFESAGGPRTHPYRGR